MIFDFSKRVPSEKQKWIKLDEEKGDVDIFSYSSTMVKQLFNLSSAEIAECTPLIKIVEADNPSVVLSNQFYTPPNFGKSMGNKFGERPEVSIESVNIKIQNPRGWILYREIDLSIVVHRPDAVFDPSKNSIMRSLLDFRKSHILTYGWTGGNSVLSQGGQPSSKSPMNSSNKTSANKSSTAAQTPAQQSNVIEYAKDLYSAQKHIRFKVVNYDFNIGADNQVHFQIRAIEDGELVVRDAVIFNNRDVYSFMTSQVINNLARSGNALTEITGMFAAEIKRFAVKKQIPIKKVINGKQSKEVEMQDIEFVKLEDVFRILFSDPIMFGLSALGYKPENTRLVFGQFNKHCPDVNNQYGGTEPDMDLDPRGRSAGSRFSPYLSYSSKSIGDFEIRVTDVQAILNKTLSSKSQISVYGMMQEIFGIVSNNPWTLSSARGVRQPEIVLRTVYNPVSGRALLQVIDRLRYIDIDVNKAPVISFNRALSFFKDVKFEVVNDEQMKSIFIQRGISRSRSDTVYNDGSYTETTKGLPAFAMMYRSAIKGNVTMLGNFIFDVFNVIFVNFGIPIWDGFFYVLNKTDTVTKEGFYSTITLQAEGSNPLGSDKFVKKGEQLLPEWVTAGGARTAEDWVKQIILEIQNVDMTLRTITGAPQPEEKNMSTANDGLMLPSVNKSPNMSVSPAAPANVNPLNKFPIKK